VSQLSSLYQDTIRRHAADPTGYRRPIDATHRHQADNPLCGDRILVLMRIIQDEITEVSFDGEACAICMASASMLCEMLPGQPMARVEELHDQLQRALEGEGDLGGAEALEPLLGVKPYPGRIRCATLPWSAARRAL